MVIVILVKSTCVPDLIFVIFVSFTIFVNNYSLPRIHLNPFFNETFCSGAHLLSEANIGFLIFVQSQQC